MRSLHAAQSLNLSLRGSTATSIRSLDAQSPRNSLRLLLLTLAQFDKQNIHI
jgi:hypothetical protein